MSRFIRQAKEEEYPEIYDLIRESFDQEVYSDHQEPDLVRRLRTSASFIPELSLVAEIPGRIVGYLLMTKIHILNAQGDRFDSLALAPVAVRPEFQGQGIGGELISAAHQIASGLGYVSVMLLGHQQYYPRFGYKPLKHFGIRLPIDVPDENCMGVELKNGALKNVNGVIRYPKEFGIIE